MNAAAGCKYEAEVLRKDQSPAFDKQYTQEPVLLRHIQRVSFLWMVVHEYRELLLGVEMVWNPAGLLRFQKMKNVNVLAL